MYIGKKGDTLEVRLPPIDPEATISFVPRRELIPLFETGVLPGTVLATFGCDLCVASQMKAAGPAASVTELPDGTQQVTVYCAKAHAYMHPADKSYGLKPAHDALACSREMFVDLLPKVTKTLPTKGDSVFHVAIGAQE